MNIYLACPYSHPSAEMRHLRFQVVSSIAGDLIRRGLTVFSPITHGHAISLFSPSIPGDWQFWKEVCHSFLSWAEMLLVVDIPGREASVGVNAEIALTEDIGLIIEILDKDYCLHIMESVQTETLLSREDKLISRI